MSPSSRDDYLLRMIREVMEALARIAGLRKEGKAAEALTEIDAARGLLLGPAAELVPRLDPASAAHVVGDPERILALARLVRAEAGVRAEEGDPARAGALRRRALAFALEARARRRFADADALVAELAAEVPEAELDEPWRTLLREARRG